MNKANKPKLLIVIGSLDLGGAERHLLTILPLLADQYDVKLFTTSFAGNYYHEFIKAGIPVIFKRKVISGSGSFVAKVLRLLSNFLRTARYIRQFDPDIVHFFLPGSYLLGGYAAVFLRRKHLLMSRRSQNDYQHKHHPLLTKLEYKLHRKMDSILANSEKVASQLRDEGVTEKQLRLIYNGVDLARYQQQPDSGLRAELGLTTDTLVLTIVANLFFYKGHRELLQALATIKTQLPHDWALLCVGRDAGELAFLQEFARELGIAKHIYFLGQRDDIPQLMSISDVGLLVSHEEGFSNAVLEFMALGKPMVVTDVGGNAEAVLDRQCGLVVPRKDVSAMSQALLKLVKHPELRQQYGSAARQRVETHFSLQQCIARYRDLYSTILEGAPISASAKPILLIVINNIEFLYSHRLPIVLGAVAAGYDVHVATCYQPQAELKHADKIHYHYIAFNRNSINPVTELRPIMQLIKLYHKLKPDLIHHMCKKSVLYGCVLTRFMKKTPVVNTVPGLGYLFIGQSLKSKIITTVLWKGFRFGFKRSQLKTIFQNDDDRKLFAEHGIVNDAQCVMIRGSGVDIDEFKPTQRTHDIPLVVLPARLLWDKGVGEFVEAARQLKSRVSARFALVGDVDPINPASIPAETVKTWVAEGIVEHWGWRNDMVDVLKQADIACLPSYREGLPKALLEAAASGLPIVTTDAPGCRDVIVHEHSGFVVPVKEVAMLARYLEQLITSSALREQFGGRARERVEQNFSTDIIVRQHLELYESLSDFVCEPTIP